VTKEEEQKELADCRNYAGALYSIIRDLAKLADHFWMDYHMTDRAKPDPEQ
jgi:hypothetical protein